MSKANRMKYADVFERNGKLYVQTMDKAISGVHVSQRDVMVANSNDFDEIGVALKAALAKSRELAPIPPRDLVGSDVPSELYSAANVHNWREFLKGAKLLSVDLNEGKIRMIPWRNVKKGFEPVKGRDHLISEEAADADLGAAVMAAFGDAR